MVQFNFTYQTAENGSASVSPEQMKTFEMAGQIWGKYLKDDTTVNIHIASNDQLPSNVVGGALPGVARASTYNHYNEFVDSLGNDITSEDDRVSSLHPKIGTMVDELGLWKEQTYFTTANAKALNISSVSSSSLDGVILMSDLSNLAWNQDAYAGNDIGWKYYGSAASTPYALDFLSVALHEIGHVLGFVSGVDNGDWFEHVLETQAKIDNGTLQTFSQTGPGGQESVAVVGDYNFGFEARKMPLDFFRYTENSSYWNTNDLATGEDAYFSIDGGATELAHFSTSKYGEGDGYQASHWLNTHNPLGIMAPTLRLDQSNTISMLDLRAFDVIGWDLAPSLLGSDNAISPSEVTQTLDLKNSQVLASLWQAASDYINHNQGSLVRDRFTDVLQMIDNSEVYEGKRRRRRETSSWQELWQEITDVFNTEASFSTFETDGLNPPSRTKRVGDKADNDLVGNGDRDILIGKQGQDFLKGKAGDDLLKGGQHRDVLVGGAGADTFVVQDKKAFDIVRDFTDGEDFLKLGSGLTFDQLSIVQDGNDTILQKDDDLLMKLRNVDASLITQADFR